MCDIDINMIAALIILCSSWIISISIILFAIER